MEELARVYAEALFGAAREQGKVDMIHDQLGAFTDALAGQRELHTFFFAPVFSTREKKEGLGRMLIGAEEMFAKAGDKEDAELVINYFGKGNGGPLEENLQRWKSMFSPPRGKKIDAVTKMDKLKARIAGLEEERKKTSPEFETELAGWEKAQAGGIDWIALEPLDLKSYEGATLSKLSDNSILASGNSPERDTYTIKARTSLTNITAVRLELLPRDLLLRVAFSHHLTNGSEALPPGF